jgi:chromosome segregation ATPase
LLGKPWPVPPESEALAEERFVDGALSQANPSSVEGKLPLWVEETDAALRRERKTGAALFAVLDRVAAQAEAAQALYGGAREQTNDLTRQLTALREQARWYEAEWQKARQRWRASRVELEKRDKQASEHHSRILKLEHTISYMRLDDSSNVREAAGWWGRFWSAFRSR